MAAFGVLCCITAASVSAATTYACTISALVPGVPGTSTNLTINAGTEITLAVGVSPGMPPGGHVQFWTPKNAIESYIEPTVNPTGDGATMPWIVGKGTYDVRVDVFDAAGQRVCTSPNDVVIVAGVPADRTTATAVTLNPANPGPGQSVEVTAVVSVPTADGYTLGGEVVFYGDSARYGSARLTSTAGATTGTATYTITTPTTEGSHMISAWYLGDEHFAPSSGIAPIGVVKAATSLVDVGGTAVRYNGTSTINAKLVNGNSQPIAGMPVDLALSTGEHCTATTAASGVAACPPMAIPHPADTYAVTASFAGTSAYASATGSGSLVVSPAQASIVYTGPTTVAVNQPATLSATLTDEYGHPLATKSVSLGFDAPGTDSCSGMTDTTGKVTCTIGAITEPAGASTVYATYVATDGYYSGATTTHGVVVATGTPTQLTFIPNPISSIPGLPTRVAFKLADASGPIAGASVAITFDGTTRIATTNASGVATIYPFAPPMGGSYPASATYPGGGTRLGTTGKGDITVFPALTILKVRDVTSIPNGTKPTLSATLKLWNGTPLAGRTVVLSAGNAGCTALTDAAGVATCQSSTAVTGSRKISVTAAFAGESGVLLPSRDTGCVYGTAGGIFVRGDRGSEER